MRFVANRRISVDHRTLGPQVMCTDVRELKRTLYVLGGLFYPLHWPNIYACKTSLIPKWRNYPCLVTGFVGQLVSHRLIVCVVANQPTALPVWQTSIENEAGRRVKRWVRVGSGELPSATESGWFYGSPDPDTTRIVCLFGPTST